MVYLMCTLRNVVYEITCTNRYGARGGDRINMMLSSNHSDSKSVCVQLFMMLSSNHSDSKCAIVVVVVVGSLRWPETRD